MRIPGRTSGFLAVGFIALAAAAGGVGVFSNNSQAPKSSTVTVQSSTVGRPIPSGFVGLSMEYRGLAAYAGVDPHAVNPVFEQLLRNLSPGQSPVLRVGGDSTDWTWVPVAGVRQPPGVKFSLTSSYLKVTAALAKALNAKLILGVNLEADSTRVASGEARAFLSTIGSGAISALEIGNEPELYGSFGWYKNAAGQHIPGRAPGYGFSNFLQDYQTFERALPRAALAGPSSGAPTFMAQLGQFVHSAPGLKLVTLHRYPLKHCHGSPVSVRELLSSSASNGLAQSVARYVGIAHGDRLPLRIDEMNAISCGGARGISDTFASALWAVDALFAMARAGVDGVNMHTVPNTINELISAQYARGHWESFVHPQYYGMLMFAQAAPSGSRFLRLSGSTATGIKVWAVRTPGGQIHLVLINKNLSGSATVRLRVPSVSATGTLEYLRAPSSSSVHGVTLGGQSFGSETTTGQLAGTAVTSSVAPAAGVYTISLPAASAATLTLGP